MECKFKDLPRSIHHFIQKDEQLQSCEAANQQVFESEWPTGSPQTQVSLPSDAFVKLVQEAKPSRPVLTSVIDSLEIEGEAAKTHAIFTLKLVVTVLTDEWSCCCLLPSTIAVRESTVIQPKSRHPEEIHGWLGIHNNQYALITHLGGEYAVRLKLYCPYLTDRGRALKFALPAAVKRMVQFSVQEKEEVQIHIENSLNMESFFDVSTNTTRVSGLLPTSPSLAIFWTEKIKHIEEEADAIIIPEETTVSVEQNLHIAIGEGHLTATALLDFSIHNGSRSVFTILICDSRTRIVSVEGRAIRKWEMIDLKRKQTEHKDVITREDCDVLRAVRVALESDVEDEYHLVIVGEIDLPGTSCITSIPTFATQDVIKEKGFLSICPTTNIEMIERPNISSLCRVDTQEISSKLRDFATTPIVLSYKFLCPEFFLEVDVRKHEDSEVLICVIEKAWYTVTFSHGTLMHNCLFSVRNTTNQYLRLKLPYGEKEECKEDISIWSASVAGNAVKPAVELDKGLVLVPIHSTTRRQNNQPAFLVEIVFVHKVPDLQHHGKVTFEFVSSEVPINELYLTLYLPTEISATRVSGSLMKLSANDLSSRRYIRPDTIDDTVNERSSSMPMQAQMRSNVFEQPKSKSRPTRVVPGLVTGAMPVSVPLLPLGGAHRYGHLLILPHGKLDLTLKYYTKSKMWFVYRAIGAVGLLMTLLLDKRVYRTIWSAFE